MKYGDRVRPSAYALSQWPDMNKKDTVMTKKLKYPKIRVLRDGNLTIETSHCSFWELDESLAEDKKHD